MNHVSNFALKSPPYKSIFAIMQRYLDAQIAWH